MAQQQGYLGGEVFYDFGDMSCGELLMALLKFLQPLSSETLVELRSLDPGAPVDIPAWCRLRGYTLLKRAGGPDNTYYLLRKGG